LAATFSSSTGPLPAVSALLKVRTWLLLVLCILYGPLAPAGSSSELQLKITHARTGQVLYECPVRVGDILRLSWIHSVEHTPWEEDYQIRNNGTLVLKTARFTSYGAGVPEYGGRHRLSEKWIIREDINRPLPTLNWMHSRLAHFALHLNGSALVGPADLPHHEPIKLFIEKERP